jgi:hypothetical protein
MGPLSPLGLPLAEDPPSPTVAAGADGQLGKEPEGAPGLGRAPAARSWRRNAREASLAIHAGLGEAPHGLGRSCAPIEGRGQLDRERQLHALEGEGLLAHLGGTGALPPHS